MVDLDASGFDEPMELAHEFEVDLNCLVMVNHKFTLEGIMRSEEEHRSNTGLTLDDDTLLRAIIDDIGRFYQGLTRAANTLAIVGLVTRLQHWISIYARQLPEQQKSRQPALVKDLELLNARLGDGPVPVQFFQALVTVRDSVIHADSQAEWEYLGKRRRVADHYTNYVGGVVDIDEDQVKEAVANAVKQVKWYDEKLYALRGLPRP
jgi:hypothetical protein